METRIGKSSALTRIVLGLLLAAGVGCANTQMTSTWTDPSAKGASLSNVAVICLTQDPGLRRTAEDTFAARLAGAHAVPSYQVLGDIDVRDRNAVKARLAEQGFQAALVLRLAGVTEQVTPVGPYGTWDTYYDWAAGTVYQPGYLQTDTIVHVVSNLYSLADGKLIWTGASQTFDPASARSLMNDVSKEVAKSIEKERLVL